MSHVTIAVPSQRGKVREGKRNRVLIYHIVFDALASMPLVPAAVRVQCLAYKCQQLCPFSSHSVCAPPVELRAPIKCANKTLALPSHKNTTIQLGSLNRFFAIRNFYYVSAFCIIVRARFPQPLKFSEYSFSLSPSLSRGLNTLWRTIYRRVLFLFSARCWFNFVLRCCRWSEIEMLREIR